jgi:hypothetical protein
VRVGDLLGKAPPRAYAGGVATPSSPQQQLRLALNLWNTRWLSGVLVGFGLCPYPVFKMVRGFHPSPHRRLG